MKRLFLKIRTWNSLMGAKTPDTFKFPAPSVRELSHNLMIEESEELLEATTKADVLDAFSDQLFVLCGNVAKYGIQYAELMDYFNKVCKSNDSKFANTAEEAEASLQKEADRLNISVSDVSYKELDGRYIIFNNKTTKVLKSVNYKEPTEY